MKRRVGKGGKPKRKPGRPPGRVAGSVRALREAATADAQAGALDFLGDFSATDAAGNLRRMIQAEAGRIAKGPGLTPAARGLLMQRLSTTIERLGKVTGESLEISPEKVVKLPAFRVVLGRMVEALRPYPDAGAAVVAVLRGGA